MREKSRTYMPDSSADYTIVHSFAYDHWPEQVNLRGTVFTPQYKSDAIIFEAQPSDEGNLCVYFRDGFQEVADAVLDEGINAALEIFKLGAKDVVFSQQFLGTPAQPEADKKAQEEKIARLNEKFKIR